MSEVIDFVSHCKQWQSDPSGDGLHDAISSGQVILIPRETLMTSMENIEAWRAMAHEKNEQVRLLVNTIRLLLESTQGILAVLPEATEAIKESDLFDPTDGSIDYVKMSQLAVGFVSPFGSAKRKADRFKAIYASILGGFDTQIFKQIDFDGLLLFLQKQGVDITPYEAAFKHFNTNTASGAGIEK
jgi:hypothetical protein